MKQKVVGGIAGMRRGDVLANFSDGQLRAIGAVAMTYNDAERHVHELIAPILRYPGLFETVASRINGLDGTVAIIRANTMNLLRLDADKAKFAEEGRRLFDQCLSDFLEVKSFRDAVLHANIFDRAAAIGLRYGRQAKLFKVLLSEASLKWLIEYTKSVSAELELWKDVLETVADIKPSYGDQPKPLPELTVQSGITLAQQHQNHRRSLQPKPKFPDQ